MKKRLSLILLAIACGGGAFWYHSYRTEGNFGSSFQHGATTNTTVISGRLARTVKRMTESVDDLNDRRNDLHLRPIVFYGLVLDQENRPVSGVAVDYTIYPAPSPPASGLGSVQSDQNGRFVISGHMGAKLGLNFKKDGFRVSSTNAGGVFSLLYPESERYVPDPDAPQIIRLWRNRGAEELVRINSQRYRCSLPVCSLRVDLLRGLSVDAGGDVVITVSRGPGNFSIGQKFDWECSIEAVEGGISLAENQPILDTTFEAPEGGYSNKIVRLFPKDSLQWHAGADQHCLLKSRNGQVYSKFYLRVSVNSETNASITLSDGYANPNSSRNWEVDPALVKQSL